MIHAIELENFKAFGQRVRIPCAPITLIFGENSCGKSSILHSLALLKQTWDARGQSSGSVFVPKAENGIDLGDFNNLLFKHDLNRNLRIRLDFPAQEPSGIELTFSGKCENGKETISLEKIIFFKGIMLGHFATFEKDHFEDYNWKTTTAFFPDYSEIQLQYDQPGNFQNPPPEYANQYKCTQLSNSEKSWHEYFHLNISQKAKLRWMFESVFNQMFLALCPKEGITSEDQKIFQEKSLTFLSSRNRFLSSLENDAIPADQAVLELQDDILKIGPFEDFLKAIGTPDAEICLPYFLSNLKILTDSFMPIAGDDGSYNYFGSSVWDLKSISEHLRETLDVLSFLGPNRQAPERGYRWSGRRPRQVGMNGEFLPDLLFLDKDNKVTENVNRWFAHLGINYQIFIYHFPQVPHFFDVRLKDNMGVELSVPDVGFGLSQLLPVIIQACTTNNSITLIEQPESQIHPRLQADIGDLFADSAIVNGNQFIIETHSEHLVLRLQRLVRQKKLKPTDVSILYVSRGNAGSTVNQIRLDEDGYFMDDWPGGFFPERLNELL